MEYRISRLDWNKINDNMNERGYACVPGILTDTECIELTLQYNNEALYRKTINMERYSFGLGEYKYYNYPLPAIIQEIRQAVYPKLSTIANNWMRALNTAGRFPENLDELLGLCREQKQTRPTPLILRYEKGGNNTLHQDLYGEVYFPMQLVLFLNEPETDYSGGEFVLIEQRPRAQSKAIVLKPAKGDMLIFTTNFRPVKGSKGYYRVNMKHGVSEISAGIRHTLGIIFHDAG